MDEEGEGERLVEEDEGRAPPHAKTCATRARSGRRTGVATARSNHISDGGDDDGGDGSCINGLYNRHSRRHNHHPHGYHHL